MKKIITILTVALSFNLLPTLAFCDTQISQPVTDQKAPDSNGKLVFNAQEHSLIDHQGKVFRVQGSAQILHKNSAGWQKLEVDAVVSEEDQIKTGQDSLVEIDYDLFHLNHARIDANTLAAFDSIEPTSISIMEGNIFNMLDGLPQGTAYEVSTPKAVASVRGTHFALGFDAANQNEKTAVVAGAVQLLPYLDKEKNISAEKSYMIKKDEKITRNYELLHADQLAQSKPEKLSKDERENFIEVIQNSRLYLLAAAGGPEAFRESIRAWIKLHNNEDKIAVIKAALRKHGSTRLKTQNVPFPKDEESDDGESTQNLDAQKEESVLFNSSVVGKAQDAKLQDSLIGASETNSGDSAPKK